MSNDVNTTNESEQRLRLIERIVNILALRTGDALYGLAAVLETELEKKSAANCVMTQQDPQKIEEAAISNANEASDAPIASEALVEAIAEVKEASSNKKSKKKKKKHESVSAPAVEVEVKTPAVKEQKEDITPGAIPKKPRSIESLQYYFGSRRLEAFNNSEILRSRLFYQYESYRYSKCFEVTDKDSGVVLGTAAPIKLEHVWRIANGYDARKATGFPVCYTTEEQWDVDRKKLQSYLSGKREGGEVFVSDVLLLSEIEYEMIGLNMPNHAVALMQTAILGEIEQTKRLMASWKKIKKYRHKVNLEVSVGGIFSSADVRRLNRMGIVYLNDLRKYNVYRIKALMLDYNFENIVREINAAFKADLERRRDRRYKVYPFLAAFKNLGIIIGSAYYYKYTLIDNTVFYYIIAALLGLCAVEALVIFIGGKRAKRRAKVIRTYRYYTPAVKRSIVTFALMAIFTVASLCIFHLRYDGYDDLFFYRDLDDGTVSIADTRNFDLHYRNNVSGADPVNLVEITVPETIDGKLVSEIGEEAFAEHAFENIILPSTLKKISVNAFYYCVNLNDVHIPESVTEMQGGAFMNCHNLKTVNLPASLTSIEPETFYQTALEHIVFAEGGEVVVKASAFENCYSLLDITNLSSVKRVEDNAFAWCTALRKLDFGTALTYIGNNAFKGCSALVSVNIPESVTYIGEGAFYDCNSVASLAIPFIGITPPTDASQEQYITDVFGIYDWDASVTLSIVGSAPIPKNAVNEVNWLSSLVISDGISEIGEGAFKNNTSLERVVMSSSVTTIPSNAFSGCSTLSKVTNTLGVSTIGSSAFSECTSLYDIDISAVTAFSSRSFYNCYSLQNIELSDSLTAIPEYCFTSTSISMPTLTEGIKTIGAYAFQNCYNVNGALDLTHVESVGSGAFSNTQINSVTFSDSITSIGSDAFRSCYNIDELTIPSSVTFIGYGAFLDCSIYDLRIPFIGPTRTNSDSSQLSNYYETTSETVVYITDTDKLYSGNFGYTYIKDLHVTAPITEIHSGAFENAYINSVYLPDSVTSIPQNLFENNGYLSSISAHGVTTVGNNAFYNAYSLENIDFPALNYINNQAFYNCYDLVNLGSLGNVISVGDYAFTECTRISDFGFTDNLVSIGARAFSNCYSVSDIGELSSLERIGNYAFQGCTSLYSLGNLPVLIHIGEAAFSGSSISEFTIPTSLGKVPAGAFSASNLSTIHISAGITSIENNAFESCSSLSSVTIEDGLISIGDYAFNNCYNLVSITLPESITAIGDYAFNGCNSLASVDLYGTNVENLGEGAFQTCSQLVSIAIPSTLSYIPANAFYSCTALYSIDLGYSVQSIGNSAFAYTAISGNIVIPDSVVEIGEEVFMYTSVNSLTVPNSVEKIGRNAFSQCYSLTSVTLPFIGESVIYSGEGYNWLFVGSNVSDITLTNARTVYADSFAGAENILINLSLNEGVTVIEPRAFEGFNYLSEINLPSSVTEIGDYAFQSCTSLLAIEVPSKVTKIGNGVFASCQNLASVILPAGLTSIGEYAFEYCTRITALEIPESVSAIGMGAFRYCSALQSINIPTRVTVINEELFLDCVALVNFDFSNLNVTKISAYAFSGTNISLVNLNSKVVTVESCAFSTWSGILVYVNGSDITMAADVFGYANSAAVYVKNVKLENKLIELFKDNTNITIETF